MILTYSNRRTDFPMFLESIACLIALLVALVQCEPLPRPDAGHQSEPGAPTTTSSGFTNAEKLNFALTAMGIIATVVMGMSCWNTRKVIFRP
jgi:hypothetical protein